MNEIKAKINALGKITEIGYIDGMEICCQMPFDFIDRFYNYKPTIEGNYITNLSVIDEYIEWHENTNFQIKFTPSDLLDLLKAHKAMIDYTDSLTQYTDLMDNVYFYVNYFNDMERELITYYGGIINEKD